MIQPYRCINTQAVSVLHGFDYDQHECNLIAAPLTHGTSCFVLPVFAQGGQQVLLETPTPSAILDAFAEYGVTTVFLPPTLIHMLMAEPGVESGSWSALRHMIYSAAPMTPEKIAAAREIFGNVIETAYGQVEAPGIITAMRPAEFSPDTLASVGRSSLLTRVEIMGPDGALLPAGELGEVVVRGDLVMSGYLDMPDRPAQAIVDGWLNTGDLGSLDDRGYVYLKSRMSDMIISGGFNVYPAIALDLKAIIPRFPDFDPYTDLYFPGGIFHLAFGKNWSESVRSQDMNEKRMGPDGVTRGVRPVDDDPDGSSLLAAIKERAPLPGYYDGLVQVVYHDDQITTSRASITGYRTSS